MASVDVPCACSTGVCLCEAENMLMPFRITEKNISLAQCSQLHTKWNHKLSLYPSTSGQQWLDRYLSAVMKNVSSTDIPPHPAKKRKKEKARYSPRSTLNHRLGIPKVKLNCKVHSNLWNQWSKTRCFKHSLQSYTEPSHLTDICPGSWSIFGCFLWRVHFIFFFKFIKVKSFSIASFCIPPDWC